MKLKVHSGFKKRFSFTSGGRIKFRSPGKRHNMIKRSGSFIRRSRKVSILSKSSAKRLKKLTSGSL